VAFSKQLSTASLAIFFQATKINSASFEVFTLLILPEGISGRFQLAAKPCITSKIILKWFINWNIEWWKLDANATMTHNQVTYLCHIFNFQFFR
jgi:hypothetical protein